MERKKTGHGAHGIDRRLPALGLAVLLGSIGGGVLYGRWEGLRTLLFRDGPAAAAFWPCFWPEAALLGIVLLAGFCRAGCPLVLAATGIKGFWLSAFSSRLIDGAGGTGYAQALCLGLAPGFLSLTALLLLGRQAMGLSLARLRQPPGSRKRLGPEGAYGLTFGVCLSLTALSAWLTCRVAPALWTAVETVLTGD